MGIHQGVTSKSYLQVTSHQCQHLKEDYCISIPEVEEINAVDKQSPSLQLRPITRLGDTTWPPKSPNGQPSFPTERYIVYT